MNSVRHLDWFERHNAITCGTGDELTAHERDALLAILRHANGNLTAWPGRELLAFCCGVGVAKISARTAALRDKGWLTIRRRPNNSSVYTISAAKLAEAHRRYRRFQGAADV